MDSPNSNAALLTVAEVAQLLRVPRSWVYEHTRLSSRPRLPHVKLGKYLRFRRAELDSFLQLAGGKNLVPATRKG